MHLNFAGQANLFFMAEVIKEGQWTQIPTYTFPPSGWSDVFRPLLDQHFARRTLPHTHAVQDIVWKRVQLHTFPNRRFSKIGPVRDFDCFLFVEELDSWHETISGESTVVRASARWPHKAKSVNRLKMIRRHKLNFQRTAPSSRFWEIAVGNCQRPKRKQQPDSDTCVTRVNSSIRSIARLPTVNSQ